MKHIIYIVLLSFASLATAQNNILFEEGNEFYNQGDYRKAIEKYEKILETNQHSAELYFNLGNANYKLNNIAPSIFYYEKALLLNPNDKDIKNNIAFAKNMTIDAIDVVPEVGFAKLLNNGTNIMSYDSWALFSVIMVVLFVVLFLFYFFSYSSTKKRIAFISSVASLAIAIVTVAFAFHKYNIDNLDKPAIVFAKESQVKSEPNLRSNEAFTLHEGTKVQVLDTLNNWKKIKLTDGKIGWISSDDIKLLKNF
jgi:tetratricopeptide (TPR) repeat protein